MLDIRTFRSGRKGLRVDLFRKYKHADSKTGTPKVSYKQVGSFSLKEGYSSDIIELLQPDEIVQLQNWLSENRFAEKFQVEPDALSKVTIRVPKILYDTLVHLHTEAKRVGIEFIPHGVMLDSLLNSARLLQHKIDKINGFKSGILESIGIDTDQTLKQQGKTNLQDEEGQILFRKLLELGEPLPKICAELGKAAQKYGSNKRIPPGQLQEWAENMPNRPPNKRIRKWHYAIAIDVLKDQGINPILIMSPAKVAGYWAIQKQKQYTLNEAIEQFIKIFDVPDKEKAKVSDSITEIYKNLTAV